jgi:hypothetical protein
VTALACCKAGYYPFGMFLVTEADADAIRAIFSQEGELSAAIELRQRRTARTVVVDRFFPHWWTNVT